MIKAIITTKEHYEDLQRWLFKLGYEWNGHGAVVCPYICDQDEVIFVEPNHMLQRGDRQYFVDEHLGKDISTHEVFDLAILASKLVRYEWEEKA